MLVCFFPVCSGFVFARHGDAKAEVSSGLVNRLHKELADLIRNLRAGYGLDFIVNMGDLGVVHTVDPPAFFQLFVPENRSQLDQECARALEYEIKGAVLAANMQPPPVNAFEPGAAFQRGAYAGHELFDGRGLSEKAFAHGKPGPLFLRLGSIGNQKRPEQHRASAIEKSIVVFGRGRYSLPAP